MKNSQAYTLKISFIISVIYVGIGTLSLLSMDPDFILSGDWAWVGLLITFPVSVIGFGIVYTEPDSSLLIISVQFLHMLLLWFIIYRIMKKRKASTPR